jgi:hypothetical protein
MDRLHDEDGDPATDELAVPYLLFTSNVDGRPRSYLAALVAAAPEETHRVWSHCLGYPEGGGDAALVDYLRGMQVRTHLLFSPYPRASVGRVRAAVDLRQSFIRFAVEADGLGPEELRERFWEWYGAGPGGGAC